MIRKRNVPSDLFAVHAAELSALIERWGSANAGLTGRPEPAYSWCCGRAAPPPAGRAAAAAGNALTAGLMGLAGQYFAKSAIFLGSAALCIPALISLFSIRSDEIDYLRARNAGRGKQPKRFQPIFDMWKNRTLDYFAGCPF